MEEMNNKATENIVTEIVEESTDKISFKDNVMAYALAGVFVTGLATIGYLGYKGTKKLSNRIRNKREESYVLEEEVINDVEDEVHETDKDHN